MKKDKYPLGGGLMPSDASRPGSAGLGGRDMYSSMSGYMPNGYHGYDTSSMADGFDGLSSTMSELHYGGSRASSPGISMLRDYRSQSPGFSYLRQGRSVSSLRRPIEPYDR